MPEFTWKLGRNPSPPDDRNLKLTKYLTIGKLPPTPQSVRYSTAVLRVGGYRMLLNDTLGCCVPAEMFHTVMQHAANAGHPMPVPSDAEVISLYSAIGGYVPGDPSTDNGCDMLTALNYWRNTGITINGVVHKIGAFAQINLADPDEINAALWIFGSTFDGVNLPAAMQNSNFWGNIPSDLSGDWEPGSWGGHCVGQADATLDPNLDLYQTVTWGGLMATDATFMKAYCDEAYVVISQDWLADNGQCPAGFDIAALTDDLTSVSAKRRSHALN